LDLLLSATSVTVTDPTPTAMPVTVNTLPLTVAATVLVVEDAT
jgi:hypothetical protein